MSPNREISCTSATVSHTRRSGVSAAAWPWVDQSSPKPAQKAPSAAISTTLTPGRAPLSNAAPSWSRSSGVMVLNSSGRHSTSRRTAVVLDPDRLWHGPAGYDSAGLEDEQTVVGVGGRDVGGAVDRAPRRAARPA